MRVIEEDIERIIKDLNLKGKSRNNKYFMPRMYFMNWLRVNTSLPHRVIGAYFDRDHSTVVCAINTHSVLTETNDTSYATMTHKIREVLDDEPKYRNTLIEDVSKCRTVSGLNKIKVRIKAGLYDQK